jgi:uncharacterized caspase-like protein
LDEFLVPYEIVSPDGINWDESMAIRDDELAEWLSHLVSQRIVVLLDTCFSGGMIDTSGQASRGLSEPLLSAQWQEGFAQDIQGSGRIIITASAESEGSWEFGDLGHGVFSYYLREAFRTPAADLNDNGWISAQEAYAYLAGRVDDEVRSRTGQRQHPQMDDQVFQEVDLVRLQPVPDACPFP